VEQACSGLLARPRTGLTLSKRRDTKYDAYFQEGGRVGRRMLGIRVPRGVWGSCFAENTGWRMLSLAADSSSLERLRLATACELWLLWRRSPPSLGRAVLPSRSSPAGSSPSPATGNSFLAQLPPPATSTADPDGDTDTLPDPGLGDPPRRRLMPAVAGEDVDGRRFDEASAGFASRPLDESAMGAATRQARAKTIIRPPE
jgi:hypothetical protein